MSGGSSSEGAPPGRLLISLPDGYHLYGFLNTGLAGMVLDGAGCACTFLIPPGGDGCVPADLRDRAAWRAFPRYRLPALARLFGYLRMEGSPHLRRSATWRLVRRKYNRTWKHVALRPAAHLLGAVPALERALFAIERLLAPSPLRRMDGWKECGTVVFGSAGVKDLDVAVLQVARRLPVRKYGVIYSWDNITSKMNGLVRFDRVAVWNHVMKDQTLRHLGYRPEQVAVVGAPQFDIYHGFSPRHGRQEFLRGLDLPPEARYVLYSGVPQQISPWGAAYVRAVLEAAPDRYVLVRTHPQDRADSYQEVRDHPRVRVFHAGRDPDGVNRSLGFWTPRPEEGNSLAEQIHYADAVVNLASTVTLEALRLDRPVVNIAFDGGPEAWFVKAEEYYHTEHYSAVANSGAVAVARSTDELSSALRNIPEWWPARARQRAALNHLIDPFQDGRAAERLAQDIVRFHHGWQPDPATEGPTR